MHIILYFAWILLQVQELIEDSDTVVIEEAETETKNDDLEESLSDMNENYIKPKRDVSYVIL